MASSRLARAITALGLLVSATGARAYVSEVGALAQVFPGATQISSQQFLVDDAQRAELQSALGYRPRERIVTLHSGRRDGQLLGHALVMNDVAKTLRVTFLVAIDPEGRVDQVVLLAFREPRGQEIEREVFRRQYVGLTRADPIRRGHDIRNISGATLSVDAMSRGVKRALLLLEMFMPSAEAGS